MPNKTKRKQEAKPKQTPRPPKPKRNPGQPIPPEAPWEGVIEYVHNELFDQADAEQTLWGQEQDECPVALYTLPPVVSSSDESEPAAKQVTLTREQEKTLFLQYNYAKFRLALIREESDGKGTRRRKRREEDWIGRIKTTQSKLVHCNLPLVPSMASRAKISGVDHGDLISEGYMALLRSIEKFDAARGFKFSTYACRAILSRFRRLGAKAQTFRKHFPVPYEPKMERSDYHERRHDNQRYVAIETVREVLSENTAKLSTVEKRVIQERYPVVPGNKPRTLAQVGKIVGLSNERVRQIEKVGLTKIRGAFEERMAV
jgi:RNA polymerase sigma factor (sigma-70 family)